MSKILYIGGFELPDKNAAAQRVLSVAKALRLTGNEICFYGITKSCDVKGCCDGFYYEACPYPDNTKTWIKYAIGYNIISYIKRLKPDIVITYNYPAIAQQRIIFYCHKNNIKVIGDITEWYSHKNVIKKLDSTLRMRWSNKKLDGIITISKYLYHYYHKYNTLLLPPIVDKLESKWRQTTDNISSNSIKLIYVGSTSIGKDRLDYILKGIENVGIKQFSIDVIGMTKSEYISIYNSTIMDGVPVTFYGRLTHLQAIKKLKSSDFQIFFRDPTRVNNAGFPTKFVESLSSGIPVITNQISNIGDYVINGKNSYIIDSPTENEIQRILYDISMLSRLEINKMKNEIDVNLFDYHKYAASIQTFIDNV